MQENCILSLQERPINHRILTDKEAPRQGWRSQNSQADIRVKDLLIQPVSGLFDVGKEQTESC